MKKFSKIINESTEDKVESRIRVDEFPSKMQDVLDLFETFKDSYDYVDSTQIEKGWTTINTLKRLTVNSINFRSEKKMKLLFPDGTADEKWKCGAKILISYKKFTPEHENPEATIYDISTIDEMINRYRAIKTLAIRCQNYGSMVKISYNTGISSDKISLIVILD